MFTSRRVGEGDVLQGWRMDHGDSLKVYNGGIAMGINVGYKADIEVTAGGVVSGVSIADGGDAEFKNATAYDISAADGSELYLTSSYVEGLSVGGDFWAKHSEIYGDIEFSGVDTVIENSFLSGDITISSSDVTAMDTAFWGTLTLDYSDVTVMEIDVEALQLLGSELSAGEVIVDGDTMLVGSVMSAGYLFAEGDVTISAGTELYLDEAEIVGNVTLTQANMVSDKTVISGGLDISNRASAYISNCILSSASINNRSYLMVSSSTRIENVNIGTSSLVDLCSAVVSGVRVGTSSYLYASASEINGLQVNAAGSAYLYNRASANMIVNESGYATIASGGVIQNGDIKNGANLTVLAGGAVRGTYISSGAKVNGFDITFQKAYYLTGATTPSYAYYYGVNFGGGFATYWGSEMQKTATDHYFAYDNAPTASALVIVSATVKGYNSAAIYSGQVADTITVSYGGQAHVSSGAFINNVYVAPYGSLYVHTGAKGAEITLTSGAYTSVYKDALVSGATVTSGGKLQVAGEVKAAKIQNGGMLSITQTGDVDATTVQSGAIIDIAKNGTINGFSLNAAQKMTGFNVSGATVREKARIMNEHTATDVTVISGAELSIEKGGLGKNITNNGGAVNVKGELSGATVANNGTLNIANGGNAAGITVNAGKMTIAAGGVAAEVTANTSGAVIVDAAGTLKNAVVNGGEITVEEQGKLSGATVKAGKLIVSGGALVSELNITGGTIAQKQTAVISGFTADKDITHNGSFLFSSATVKTGDTATLAAGMRASGVKVAAGGKMNVNGGSAYATVISSGASLTAGANGYAAGNKAAAGAVMNAVSGGIIDTTVLDTAATANAYNGGIIRNMTANAGKVNAYSGGIVSNATVNAAGVLNIANGGIMKAGSIEKGVDLSIANGGSACNVAINSGSLTLEKGAYGSGNTVLTQGKLFVSGGATAAATVVNSGFMSVSGGATIRDTVIKYRSELSVSGGAIVEGITFESGTKVNGFAINNYQTAANFLLSDAIVSCHTTADLYDKQSAARAKVSSDAILNVWKGGVAIDANVSAGTVIANGGTVSGAAIIEKGLIVAYAGAQVNNVQVNDGDLFIYDAVANNNTVNTFGTMSVENKGVANNTMVSNGDFTVAAGAKANGISIKNGAVKVHGTADGVKLVAGTFTAYNGASVSNSVVSGGNFQLNANTVHSGTMFIAAGQKVVASPSTTIDFTVAGRTTKDTYIINNVSRIEGMAVYTVTTDAYMSAGAYKLAQGASAFTGSISVKNTSGAAVAALTVNGASVYYQGASWSLKQSGGNLTLNVAGQEASSISANGVSQIIAWDAKRGTVGMVATSKNAPAQWRGIWDWSSCCGTGSVCCSDKWKVVGTGRFKGTAVDTDGILLYNNTNNTFAAWTDLSNPSYGYVSLCHVEDNFSVMSVTNFNNNQFDDVLIYDEKGNFGIVIDGTSYKDVWHVNNPADNNIKLIGAGYFGNADGTSSILVQNTATNTYHLWNNSDITFATWAWGGSGSIGAVEADWEVAGIGDFQGDGIDDIIVMNNKTGYMFAWENGNSSKTRWVGAVDAGDWEVAAVGDYNGDGKDDLLLRELVTGWGGLGYWGAGYAGNWVDLNARVENNQVSNFAVIA